MLVCSLCSNDLKMDTKTANLDISRKSFLQLSLAVTISTEEINEMHEHLKQLNDKINKTDTLYMGCLKRSMEQRINRQLDRHEKLVNTLKMKAALYH